VGESGDETIHELVRSIAATAKVPTESLLDVSPFDVVEDLNGPIFNLHDVFPGGALHHPLTEKVSTASGVRDAANNKIAGGRGKRDRSWRCQRSLAEIGSGAIAITLDV
jgi:hypothetical protein